MTEKSNRPEPEDFGSATLRLLKSGAITQSTAYNMSRASDVTGGEAIRVLTDIAIHRQEWSDKLAELLAAEEKSVDNLTELMAKKEE